MSDVSKVKIDETLYDFKDKKAREEISKVKYNLDVYNGYNDFPTGGESRTTLTYSVGGTDILDETIFSEYDGLNCMVDKIKYGYIYAEGYGDDYGKTKLYMAEPYKFEIYANYSLMCSMDWSKALKYMNDFGGYYKNNHDICNYVLFGDYGVYYVQNVEIDREAMAAQSAEENVSEFCTILKNPIVTEITDLCEWYHHEGLEYNGVLFENTDGCYINLYNKTEDLCPLISGSYAFGMSSVYNSVNIIKEG